MKVIADEEKQYQEMDIPFYREEVLPILPRQILDFHAHIWKKEHWINYQFDDAKESPGRYMVTDYEYSIEQLMEDGKNIFPDNLYSAVCFGQPTPSADSRLCNEYVQESCREKDLYPLMILGKDHMNGEELEAYVNQKKFYGYKVYLNWVGNDYQNIQVNDMIGHGELEIANKYNLVVLLHVPGEKRLADSNTQKIIREYSRRYPDLSIVLAHCGRCYHPDEMKKAINSIIDLDNVYLDTSMVMDATVIQIILDNIDSRRLLFATDFPVAVMRGRRVYVMDHWVDVVLEGYSPSAYRICSNNMRATFMAYEIVLAIRRGAEMAGLPDKKAKDIFYKNGMEVLKHVVHG